MNVFVVGIIFLCATTSFASVWNRMGAEEKRATHRALAQGAEFDVRFRVVDEEGRPVENAKCSGWAYLERDRNRGKGHDAQTDSNGVVRVAGKCGEWVSIVLRKEGYYRTMFDVKYPFDSVPAVVDGKWQPYGETRTVVLKSIVNPVRLRDLDVPSRYKYPELGKWAAFDLEHCDWVAPLGAGTHADVLLKFSRESRPDGFLKGMEVSFTNNPHAGVYLMSKDSSSEMDSVYTASTNAQFVGNLRYEFERTAKGNHVISELGSGQYLVFRTRTKVDHNGKLVSAHYGKIMGEWRYVEKGGMALGPVFFNPTPNDTNLEDAETARRSRLGYKQSLEFEKVRKR